jgi:crotonobetaine/carnitine-CoA ligase
MSLSAQNFPQSSVKNLGELITRASSLWPAQTAWIFDETGEMYSFQEVDSLTEFLAQSFSSAGISRGDRVGLLAKNSVEFVASWLAFARLGAVMVPMNVNYGMSDASHVLNAGTVTNLITVESFRDFTVALSTRCPLIESVIFVDALVKNWRSGATTIAKIPLDTSSASDVANIQFTSGTTGKPKGCVLGHDYWLTIAFSLCNEFPNLNESDVMLTAQPFYYIDPQWNVVSALMAGAELVILDRFHPSSFWDRVRHYNVTYFYCLGLMPTLLLDMPPHARDRDNKVRAIQASAIPPAIHQALESRWATPWFEAFGMTETGADLFVGAEEHDELVGTGCLGKPRAHREALVLGADGIACDPGETGQLLLRGAGLMQGYFNDIEATQDAFEDGWFRTGDLASTDAKGRLYYRGRTKDMIRRSGENISAVEVEEVLTADESIAQAAVIAVEDRLRGEEIFAIIVPARDEHELLSPKETESLLDEIIGRCKAELAYFKVPRYWKFASALPRTVSERVDKHTLGKIILDQTVWDSKEGRWHA